MKPTRLLLIALLPLTGACATITRGTSEAWTVTSDPSGAEVKLSTGQECITPCTLKLKRKESFTVTIHKPGYRTVTTQVISQVAGAGAAGMAGNLIVGGIIGVGVDAATGATKERKPNPLEVVLEVEESASRGSRPRPPWQRGGRGQAQRGARDRPDRRPATIRRDRKGRQPGLQRGRLP
jgi:hypothetical protein